MIGGKNNESAVKVPIIYNVWIGGNDITMWFVRFNEAERDLFRNNEVNPFVKILYFNLRGRMDYATSIVGMPPHKLSYAYLGWDVDYKPRSGSKEVAKVHKRSQLINYLSVLKKLGFLEPVTKNGKTLDLVFKLLKADSKLIYQNELQQSYDNVAIATTTGDVDNSKMEEKTSNHRGLSSCCDAVAEEGSEYNFSNAETQSLQHISGTQVTTSTNISKHRNSYKGYLLDKNWLPSKKVLEQLNSLGIEKNRLVDFTFSFKSYYLEAGYISRAWNHKFYEWCLREIKKAS